jgi:dTDP-4-dehydrorhamnose reductase
MNTKKKRVLITGASGLLGGNLVFVAPQHWDIIAVTYRHTLHNIPKNIIAHTLDLRDEKSMHALRADGAFDAIIHAAALTNVDQCEQEPLVARDLNTTIAERMALFAREQDAHLVQISTDHIFNGVTGPYYVTDAPTPINEYARSKLEAERCITALAHTKTTIVRTNFFGYNVQEKNDLAGWMLQELAQENPIRLFTDVLFSPLLVNRLIAILIEIIDQRIYGTQHVAARDGCSKYEFGMMLADAFACDTALITPISIDESELAVARPKDMRLNIDASAQILETQMPTIAESIEYYRQLECASYASLIKKLL